MLRKLRKYLTVGMLAAGGLVGSAQANYSGLVIFGDSISDTGNVFSLTSAYQPPAFPNYFGAPGRFSDGPVWTEYLAAGLGFANSANPSNLLLVGPPTFPVPGPTVIETGVQGGQNFAYGGARTLFGGSAGPTTGLLGQLVAWDGTTSLLSTNTLTKAADPNVLYVVMAGANDLRDARDANSGTAPADVAQRAAAAAAVAQNITNVVGLLAQQGAQHFLISNLPDLGRTPEAMAAGNVTASTDITNSFNAALNAHAAGLDAYFLGLTGVNLDIRMLDFHGLVENIALDATNNGGATYGITNITTACINAVAPTFYFVDGATGTNCAASAFSDDLHPSGAVHALLGQAAIAAAVPEPSTYAMFFAGLVVLVAARRRLAAPTRAEPAALTAA